MTAEAAGDPHPAGVRGPGSGEPGLGRLRAARWAAPLLIAPVLLLLAACAADAQTTDTASTPSPFADCTALTQPPAAVSAASPASTAAPTPAGSTGSPATAAGSAAGKGRLPDLELPCFTGGAAVKLAGLPGPAVINLWASWCGPCRAELPAMQQLADHAAGKLTVFGVDTFDRRAAAASFGTDSKVVMPTLFDPDKKLIGALGYTNLPVTIFVGAGGAAHVEALPLDDAKLGDLVKTWTGVTVTP